MIRAAILLLALTAACTARAPQPPTPAGTAGTGASAPPAPAAPGLAALSPAAPDPSDDDLPDPGSPAETVTIKLIADSHRQAHVLWGRKDLGVAPLEIQRPRGSGPLDLLVVAPGFLPLHTRVFTDRGEILPLRLYSEKEATALLGWLPPKSP